MRTLVLGAGATGGYLGVALLAAGRDVTFLVRPPAADRLRREGLRFRGADGTLRAHEVTAVTAGELHDVYDLVVVAVRGAGLAAALADLRPAVGPGTRVVPLLNGMAHLDTLVAAFGSDAVLGATVRLGATLLPDGTLDEIVPGAALELGRLDGPADDALGPVRDELSVDGVTVTVVDDVRRAMWAKWAFIAASTVLTVLAGGVVGDVATTPGGPGLSAAVVDETLAVAAAEGHPLHAGRDTLVHALSDPDSRFAPSLARELWAGRAVEIDVLQDLADRARRHALAAPLLEATLVRVHRTTSENLPLRR